ncbi:phosphotriesterase [Pseudomonas sp. Fl5BN2]|nr:phosphotriesterase [Pseudomonas sp. Fl5BN2]NBF11947.1 phosphotriesterase [Pseudomonas sp. Fl4BN1]
MSNFKHWGWDSKKRTMLRFIKPGDIFCFQISNDKFGFGRIISKVSIGHSAEIFDCFSPRPCLHDIFPFISSKATFPLVLDSYSLFDKKISGEWRIIGHQIDMPPNNFEGIYFVCGTSGGRKKVDMFGNACDVSDKKSDDYPPYMPKNHYHVMNMLSLLNQHH